MFISFDLGAILCLIIIPPLLIYLCRVAWELARRTRLLINNEYLAKTFKKHNEIMKENIRLKNKIAELTEDD